MPIRSPICTVVGHVDHGKSSILDWIRGTSVVAGEAGAITQAIGASNVPLSVIKEKAGSLLTSLNINFTIPGLLFIDTPGHAAFTNLRKRGGNLADIAILVVDINEGLMPQTIEAIEILKSYKTPFIIAANKIDLINGWMKRDNILLKDIDMQMPEVIEVLEKKMYDLVRRFFEVSKMDADRFDRVSDYTKQIAIVPCSAKTGEGLPELLMTVAGLAQRYLGNQLQINEGNAKGTILEVKDVKGLGKSLDIILYDGTLKVGDTIVIGGLEQPIITKVKAIFAPSKMGELREKKTKFESMKEITAASGVRIAANDIETVVAGMPMVSASKDTIEQAKQDVQKQIEEVTLATDAEGIVIKADSLGSLEALSVLLKEKGIRINSASIGNITKKDIAAAESNYEKDKLNGIILGFNVISEIPQERIEKIKILTNDVIYRLIEDLDAWRSEKEKEIEMKQMEGLTRPCKIKLLKNFIFRQSNPAVIGAEVLGGILKPNMPLMLNGKQITTVKAIESEKQSISSLEEGKQAAVSLDKIVIGRTIQGDETLYSAITEREFRIMREFKKALTPKEIEIIKEIAQIMRKDNPLWGV